jgi:hypothetical protein
MRANGMPKKKPSPKGEKSQKERFLEAAKSTGADTTGKEFEAAVKKIVPAAKPVNRAKS